MQVPLQITTRNIDHSEALDAHIREKVAKLEQFHGGITSCRVTVEELNRHQHQGRQFSVHVDVRVPGREIAVSRDHDEDVYVALRDAFDAAKRQLEEVVRERRGDVKVHAEPRHGVVVRLLADQGHGFIETGDGRQLYFSRENVVHPTFDQLRLGTPVQFIEEMAAEGPQAKRVTVGKHGG
jgi:ribosomal subunit interface protein